MSTSINFNIIMKFIEVMIKAVDPLVAQLNTLAIIKFKQNNTTYYYITKSDYYPLNKVYFFILYKINCKSN